MAYYQNVNFIPLERKALIRKATIVCTNQLSSWQSLQMCRQLNEHGVWEPSSCWQFLETGGPPETNYLLYVLGTDYCY